MTSFNFQPPKSVQAIRTRNNEPLNDNRGVFKAYMSQVNDLNIDVDSNIESETKVVARALQFNLNRTNPSVGSASVRFNLKW